MTKILQVRTVHDYNAYVGQPDGHPLVSVIHYDLLPPIRHALCHYAVYGLFLRDDRLVELTYGAGLYDYDESTLICVQPGQTGGKEDNGERCPIRGWALLFHPDLVRGTFLEEEMQRFTFFAYRVNEALRLTPPERATLINCLRLIRHELAAPDSAYRREILVGLIATILHYCLRFHDRQFRTRRAETHDVPARFEQCLHRYFSEHRQLSEGLPTVRGCAAALCMSPNYFADLIKQFTGETASAHIRRYVMERAKSLLVSGKSVSETAYALGFDYPQHFSRLFKQTEGLTPSAFTAQVLGRKEMPPPEAESPAQEAEIPAPES